MTPCSLQECIDADMPRFFELFSLGFGPEKYPYVEHVFPKHDTSEGRKIGGERMLTLKHLDAQATWLKITENPSEKMIACAKWNIYSNTIPPEFGLEGEYWDSQDEKEYAQHLFAEYLVPRRKAIRDSGGNLVILDLLIVDPEYQRQGAGRMLVKWGTDVADRMGVEVSL
ncbi:hypothetical protein GQ43DRAFT_445087 [Delitschia confertaspora ATCC 74209]|uniref:N-acetyltransferase domain-containing protein n=1 Tax=Delitschia confertaspora ATCC 74209 TaxID=1513339 RepID=A0A9P4JEP3_9PLEO|nr:hypothetical protein GQ43DRAFT_445087 [Delitschia confertaspora ATCC 74209]